MIKRVNVAIQAVHSHNTRRPRQNGCHFAYDIFKCIFLNENVWISIKISPNLDPKGSVDTIPALVQIMAWRRWPGDKPLSQLMLVTLLTDICVIGPQWVKSYSVWYYSRLLGKLSLFLFVIFHWFLNDTYKLHYILQHKLCFVFYATRWIILYNHIMIHWFAAKYAK